MYAIIDCDNCYVSCERVFRPDLNGKPVVVLSNLFGILNKFDYSYILIIPNILCKLLIYCCFFRIFGIMILQEAEQH